jgi:hypothetical protein
VHSPLNGNPAAAIAVRPKQDTNLRIIKMITKSQANKATKILQSLKDAKEQASVLTDDVVARDVDNGTDDMQSAFWQNFQYLLDSIDEDDLEAFLSESKSFYGKG